METNKQQLPLKVLIDELVSRRENIIKNSGSMTQDMLEGGVMAFESAIDLAQSLLETEKERLIDAFDEGQEYEYQYHINSTPKFDSETWYNETYGGKEQ